MDPSHLPSRIHEFCNVAIGPGYVLCKHAGTVVIVQTDTNGHTLTLIKSTLHANRIINTLTFKTKQKKHMITQYSELELSFISEGSFLSLRYKMQEI